ncbi:MbcA/ParS/Xre antitoxin family protein [Aliivibrio sp. S3MY1]|jgi:uncharacterized protein (DUF2384 family)|uniref:MbcA/ParS/Xre antitoxin family protein n=1 Tax=Aliivibrio sp. S3MY1 TaxID=3028424 RepID=UPI00237847B1|nr:MbcA/ParS/Xre antitoxin family protein [Aliivibrio sp. S3MY1]MDD9196105.1 MbcA/ParS/Xre antitoxin family protein [Aliivibrio sp. S3MY1]
MDSYHEVKKAALKLFKKEELTEEWLNTPKWFFDGLTPMAMLDKVEGKEAVLSILSRISNGDFS